MAASVDDCTHIPQVTATTPQNGTSHKMVNFSMIKMEAKLREINSSIFHYLSPPASVWAIASPHKHIP